MFRVQGVGCRACECAQPKSGLGFRFNQVSSALELLWANLFAHEHANVLAHHVAVAAIEGRVSCEILLRDTMAFGLQGLPLYLRVHHRDSMSMTTLAKL